MYIGSTDSKGLIHCLWEIIDNSVDEALQGFGKKIDIELFADGSIQVSDYGRGVPVDIEPKTGLSGVEVVFTKLHAGGKFGTGSYSASGGLHGVGASVVNALSERLDVQVDRDGATWQMSFRRGEPGVFKDQGEPSPNSVFTPFEESSKLSKIAKVAKGVTGTRVRFWPDRQIFTKNSEVQIADVTARLRQTAYLVPGLSLNVRDNRTDPAISENFNFAGGIIELVEHHSHDSAITDIWHITGEGNYNETVPVLQPDGTMSLSDVERTMGVDIAIRWGIGYETNLQSFVNIIATPKGGSHVQGFEQSLLKTIRDQVSANARKLKVGNDKVEKEDVLTGLTAALAVRISEPQFEGQTKEILGTPAARAVVAKVLADGLKSRLTSTKREYKAQSAALLEKVVSEMKARVSARVHKENQRRKNALESSTLPAKLVDCRSSNVADSELFIVEGDSALGTAKLARDSEYQALLPIRGKILNVQKASVSDVLSNAECAAIIQVIGAGSGRTFDLDIARYGKVIIMSDADVDGAHIRTLLLTLFHRYMKPLVEAGRVYAAVPPLHRVIVTGSGNRSAQTIYTYSEAELQTLLKDLQKSGKRYKEPIQRYKGLGEMDADQLAETTMSRSGRMLRRITLNDTSEADKVFELLMGNEVAPRRDFITNEGANLERERIDA
ncbi:MAG: type IIA DNA topoisomerase subunit B [Microbacteriaceae bacterium]|nr:type IIA DNA topoisomerase subunit B [Microbacteriaceae bacterium]